MVKLKPEGKKIVGQECEIDTSQECPFSWWCYGRSWPITEESRKRMESRTGLKLRLGCGFCEHILEMD